jgi:hypothetical protein
MKRWFWFAMILLCAGLPFAFAQEQPPATDNEAAAAVDAKPQVDPAFQKAADMVKMGKATMAGLKDFTATFNKHEWKGGKMLSPETVFMKWRRNPRSVYMKWIGEHNKNQEIIWVKGKNDNKIKAHQGGFLKLIAVSLDPLGSMAMKESRHPVMHAGFDHTVELIAKDMKLSMDHPDWGTKVKDLGVQSIHGAKSYCYEATMDKKAHPEFYAYKALICMHLGLKVPNKVHIWDYEDGQVRLVEEYSYQDIKLNVGLTDKDFDPDNEEYAF